MPLYSITEVDRDYRTVSGHEVKAFENRAQADEWCRNASWTGYHYFVEKEIASAPHPAH
jgi:hypothetical protein